MVIVTPAADLQRISEGVDWIFVLDKSGSMSGGKIATLSDGVSRAIGKMEPNDRFRVITFNNGAQDFSGGYKNATPANVKSILGKLSSTEPRTFYW
jgi:Ca-activated chloride channel family protein